MKQKHKLLTFILAVLFVLGLMVSPALAQSESAADPETERQAMAFRVAAMRSLKIRCLKTCVIIWADTVALF